MMSENNYRIKVPFNSIMLTTSECIAIEEFAIYKQLILPTVLQSEYYKNVNRNLPLGFYVENLIPVYTIKEMFDQLNDSKENDSLVFNQPIATLN